MFMMTFQFGWSSHAVNPKTLSMTLNNCIDIGTLPDIWEQSNLIPVHKKGNKQIVDNYRPVSLLPIFGKIGKKIKKLNNSIMDFNNSSQSDFKPNDSCESQVLASSSWYLFII